jgi:hypothetical protein
MSLNESIIGYSIHLKRTLMMHSHELLKQLRPVHSRRSSPPDGLASWLVFYLTRCAYYF